MGVDQSENDKQNHIGVYKINYLRLVGLINYLASYTRPDLLYSLSRAAQACSNPTRPISGELREYFVTSQQLGMLVSHSTGIMTLGFSAMLMLVIIVILMNRFITAIPC